MKNLQSPDLNSWEPFINDHKMELSEPIKKYLKEQLVATHGGHIRNDLIVSALFSVYRWKSFSICSIPNATGQQVKGIRLQGEKNEITKAFSSYLKDNIYLIPLDPNISLFVFETSISF